MGPWKVGGKMHLTITGATYINWEMLSRIYCADTASHLEVAPLCIRLQVMICFQAQTSAIFVNELFIYYHVVSDH